MRFRVKALAAQQGIVELLVDAQSDQDARRIAEADGMRVLSLRPERRMPALALGRAERFPLLLFSQELATLLGAGLALIDSLESLAEKEHDAATARVLGDLVRMLHEGKSLSVAMSAYPSIFPELYVALLKSGERTGGLADALTRYSAYRARLDELRQRVLSASLYPLLLMLVGGVVMVFLIGYVVPRFSLVFDGMGTELPWLSRKLLESGRFVDGHRALVFGSGLLLALGVALALRLAAVRRGLIHGLARIRPLGERIRIYRLTAFYRAVGILLQGGIALLPATEMARGLLGEVLGARLDAACGRVREGVRFSAAMEEAELAPAVAQRMLRAGERSGNLGEMMERCANFYEQELARWIDWFVRLFEPALMAVIGVMIGTIVVLMYMPIFELAGSIQ